MIRFHVLTIFPEVFPGPLGIGVVGRAIDAGDVELRVHDLRDAHEGRHRQVDDMPFGGGAGMVFKPEPVIRAVRALRDTEPTVRCILLSPQGRRFDQSVARELAAEQSILLVCGRYQGVDQRARDEIGDELSVGDYVLSGGEVAAMAVIEATARLVPGVLGSPGVARRRDVFRRHRRRLRGAALHPPRGLRGAIGPRGPARRQPCGHRRVASRMKVQNGPGCVAPI